MIYSVKGKLTHIEPNLAVIETAGIGFACRTTANSLSGLKTGSDVAFKTYLHVREDAVELFGFAEIPELNCFKMLMSVSGVGPKAALSILSDLTPQGFALCVASGDYKRLTKAQGVGAKIAQRIILELKDRIDKQQTLSASEWKSLGSGTSAGVSISGDAALSALMVLGFSAVEAAGALSGTDAQADTSERIKQALKNLSGA